MKKIIVLSFLFLLCFNSIVSSQADSTSTNQQETSVAVSDLNKKTNLITVEVGDSIGVLPSGEVVIYKSKRVDTDGWFGKVVNLSRIDLFQKDDMGRVLFVIVLLAIIIAFLTFLKILITAIKEVWSRTTQAIENIMRERTEQIKHEYENEKSH